MDIQKKHMKKQRSPHKLHHRSSRKATNLNRADNLWAKGNSKTQKQFRKKMQICRERGYTFTQTQHLIQLHIVPKHKTTDSRTRFHILLFGILNCIHNNLRSSGEQPHHLRTATTNVVANTHTFWSPKWRKLQGIDLDLERVGVTWLLDGAAICEELGGRVGVRDTPSLYINTGCVAKISRLTYFYHWIPNRYKLQRVKAEEKISYTQAMAGQLELL